MRPQLLLATGGRAAQLVFLLSSLHGIPWVAVGHGGEFGSPSALGHALVRRIYSRARAVICVSEYTRNYMEGRGIRPAQVFVIPNGADEQAFHPVEKAEVARVLEGLGLAEPSRLILTVGNVCDRKGQETVIRAMPEILKRVPTARYLAVGLPTAADHLTGIARDLGVLDRVHFPGRQPAPIVLALMGGVDVFAMTSRRTPDGDFEGFGIAVVEAALCGTPAVVTSGSGLSEAIVDGETGLSVPEGDAGAAAGAVTRLLTDEPLRRRMGDAARRRALADQTWTRRAAQYDRVLRDLLGGASADGREA